MKNIYNREIGIHRAKTWQIALFALNNAASNIILAMMLAFVMMYSTDTLFLNAAIVGLIATAARLMDGVTDPIIGYLMDRTDTRFGKFRPWMLVGNIILFISMLGLFSNNPEASTLNKYLWHIFWYLIYIIGYTFQTAATKAAQVVLTNDPKQRPLFSAFSGFYSAIIFNIGIGSAVLLLNYFGGFQDSGAWQQTILVLVSASFVLTLLAVWGIAEKDTPEYIAVGTNQEKPKFKDYAEIFVKNRSFKAFLIAATTDKLAGNMGSAILIYFYMYVMGNTSLQAEVSLYLTPVAFGFLMLSVYLARKLGQKKAFLIGTWTRLVGLIALLLISPFGNPSGGLLFFALMIFMTGAASMTSDIQITMLADLTEYEAKRSGKFVPGMIGTAFSLVDKLVSSLGTTIVGFTLSMAGYHAGMELTDALYWAIIFCLIIVPILGHVATVIAMRHYILDKEYMERLHGQRAEKESDKPEKFEGKLSVA